MRREDHEPELDGPWPVPCPKCSYPDCETTECCDGPECCCICVPQGSHLVMDDDGQFYERFDDYDGPELFDDHTNEPSDVKGNL